MVSYSLTNPIFDTGVFLVMLILAPLLFFSSLKAGTLLLLPATAIFLVLGLPLISGFDVVSYRLTTDGTTIFNETNYFIKNTMTAGSTQWLGWVFITFGFISGAKFLMDITDPSKKIL